jgi:chaperonin GroES
VEEVVGHRDGLERGAFPSLDDRFGGRRWRELIVLRGEHEGWNIDCSRGLHRRQWRRDQKLPGERGDRRVECESDHRPERVPRRDYGTLGHLEPEQLGTEQLDGRRGIGHLGDAAAELGPEIEPQCGDTDRGKCPEQRGDHMIVAVAAVRRVRMADDGGGPRRRREREVAGEFDAVGGPEFHEGGTDLRRRSVRSWLHGSDGTLDPMAGADDKLPIKMLNDRVLVRISERDGERRSSGGIVIPATAQVSKRLIWATVVAQGQNVRACEIGDKVLFSPDDRYEVEVQGEDYVMLRERELHAVAAERIEASTGLYL